MPRHTKAEQAEALQRLHDHIQPGDTIYTTVAHVARSGMYRVIRVKAIIPAPEIGPRAVHVLHLGYNVAIALGLTYKRDHEGIAMHGCGYDAAYDIVYNLSLALFGAPDKLRKESL